MNIDESILHGRGVESFTIRRPAQVSGVAALPAELAKQWQEHMGQKPSIMRRRRKDSLVEPSFEPPCTFTVPLLTTSEANKTGKHWSGRYRRTDSAWKAVSRALGPRLGRIGLVAEFFHAGRIVRCTLTRLAPRELDRTVNLPSSLKAVEDAVAFIMGIDDGNLRWRCVCEQEQCDRYGVRIRLEVCES